METISSFLEKFRKIQSPLRKKELVVEAIKKASSIEIKTEEVFFQSRNIVIKTNPYLKSEIMMKKPLVLEEIKKISQYSNIQDIR